MKYMTVILSGLFFAGCSVVGIRTTEEPDYSLIYEEEDFEVREYGEILVAETTSDGEYSESTRKGFRKLAGYIFGDNTKKMEIAMTAPVMIENENVEIAMTAPVLQQKEDSGWRMQFVMPSEFTINTLPLPNNSDVTLKTLPKSKFAVVRFSGFLSEENIRENSDKLLEWIADKGYTIASQPQSAGYDPPWTIPFLRRNEVMVKLGK